MGRRIQSHRDMSMTAQKTFRPKRVGWSLALAGLALGAMPGCDFLDPTRVENPQTTTDDLAQAAQPTAALMPGLRAQFARALGGVVLTTENVSDNYSIQATNISKELDDPFQILPNVGTLNSTGGSGAYWNLQELRATADFILNDIAAGDDTATPELQAEAQFYRGMALLMLGENFVAAPVEQDGEPVPSRQLLERAAADLGASLQTAPAGAFAHRATAALARAHRALGNAAEARRFAREALAADAGFIHAQGYDINVENVPWIFLIATTGQTMQPLPRLDFLDPKYTDRESEIPFAKAEEMHLILAEADLAEGKTSAAAMHVSQAVALAHTRPTLDFVDTDSRRNADQSFRPRDNEILVRADADSPLRDGLVLGFGTETAVGSSKGFRGDIVIPTVSGTSLDADSVGALSGAAEVAHALFLARQEILFLEGRRMSDLGIRLPIAQREIDASPTIEEGGFGTQIAIPAWIPRGGDMDLFNPLSPYVEPKDGKELATNEVTLVVDMNRVLADNFAQASPFRAPPQ
jgi:tetratricopeptide (TPR) repeat protein